MDLSTYHNKGQYYGYPKCCIDNFIKKRVKRGSINDHASNGSGFIPCDNHATQIINKQIKLEDLILNRICEKHFPNGDGNEIIIYRLKMRFRIVLKELKKDMLA